MSSPAVAPAPQSSPWWRRVNVGTVVGTTIAGGLFGYMSNVWIMAVRSDGFNVKGGSAAAAPGNLGQGSMFWLLGPTVVFAIVGYWRAVGSKRFLFEMRRLPGLLLTLGRSSGGTFQVQFLLGALVGVVASVWIGPALGAVCSVGFLAMLPTPASSVLSSIGYKATHFLASKLARPSPAVSPEGAGLMSSVVVLFGSATALLVGFFLNSTSVKWALAAALVLLLVLRSSRLRSASLPLIVVFVGLVGIGLLVSTGTAAADDGGWSECSGESWWSCPGSDAVREWAALGGFLGALGGAAGGILGGVIGGWPAGSIFDDPEFLSPGDPGNELDPSDADEWIRGVLGGPDFGDWASTHTPSDPMSPEEFDDYMHWRHEQGLEDPPLPEAGGDAGAPGPAEPGEFEEPGGVTLAEGAEEPVDKFEGSEGWSGDPEQDEFGDFFTSEVEEEIFGDAELDEIFESEEAEEEPDGEEEAEVPAGPGVDAPEFEERYAGVLDNLSQNAFAGAGVVDLSSVLSTRDALSLTLGAEKVAGESARIDDPNPFETQQKYREQEAKDAQSPTVWLLEGTRDTAGDLVVPTIRIGSAYLTSGLSEVLWQSFGATSEFMESPDVGTGLVNATRYLAQNNLPVNTVGEASSWAGGADVTWDQWLGAVSNDILAGVGLSKVGNSLGLAETTKSAAGSHFETPMSASQHRAFQAEANSTNSVISTRRGNPSIEVDAPGKPVEVKGNTVKTGAEMELYGEGTAGRVPASAPPRPPRDAPPEVQEAYKARSEYWERGGGEAEFNKLRSKNPDYGKSERGMLTYKGREVTGDTDIRSITDTSGNPRSPEFTNQTSQRLGPGNRVEHGAASENPALQSKDPAVVAKALKQLNEPGGMKFQPRWVPGAGMFNQPQE